MICAVFSQLFNDEFPHSHMFYLTEFSYYEIVHMPRFHELYEKNYFVKIFVYLLTLTFLLSKERVIMFFKYKN